MNNKLYLTIQGESLAEGTVLYFTTPEESHLLAYVVFKNQRQRLNAIIINALYEPKEEEG